jgi:hypothetical protein
LKFQSSPETRARVGTGQSPTRSEPGQSLSQGTRCRWRLSVAAQFPSAWPRGLEVGRVSEQCHYHSRQGQAILAVFESTVCNGLSNRALASKSPLDILATGKTEGEQL